MSSEPVDRADAKVIGECRSRVMVNKQRAAFTLLELVLTLSMSIVLMILIYGAIQFYTRDMNLRDMDVRQMQLATALLQMIEDDLRASLHSDPIDTSGLEAVLASLASDGDPLTGAGEGQDLSAAGLEDESEPVDSGDELADLTGGQMTLAEPGLIGNQYQIQVDVSRLPRLEEYTAMYDEDNTDIDDIPSDIKTVTYFVEQPGVVSGVTDGIARFDQDMAGVGTGGLVRRSLDRAVNSYASTTGSVSALDATGDLLAPEVLSIEFEYWDGLLWQVEWSSDSMGELPLAVRVTIAMANPASQSTYSAAPDESDIRKFSHLVRLPLGRPRPDDESDGAETGSTL